MTDEWLTIKEAADRFGKPERTLRRYVAMLAAQDVRKRQNLAALVRFAALQAMLLGVPTDTPGEPETSTDDSVGPGMAVPDNAALIEALQSEIANLRGQLQTRTDAEARRDAADAELRRLWLEDKRDAIEVRRQVEELRQRLAIVGETRPETDIVRPDAAAQEVKPAKPARRWWEVWKR